MGLDCDERIGTRADRVWKTPDLRVRHAIVKAPVARGPSGRRPRRGRRTARRWPRAETTRRCCCGTRTAAHRWASSTARGRRGRSGSSTTGACPSGETTGRCRAPASRPPGAPTADPTRRASAPNTGSGRGSRCPSACGRPRTRVAPTPCAGTASTSARRRGRAGTAPALTAGATDGEPRPGIAELAILV